mgnify:CR=1 FL=1
MLKEKTNKINSCLTAIFLVIMMITVTPSKEIKAEEHGIASFYHEGQYIACGVKNGKSKKFNPDGISAAHKTLPCGTKVKVTRKDTGKSIVLTITDRGPYIPGRIIDLSRGAAKEMDMLVRGIVPVKVSKL